MKIAVYTTYMGPSDRATMNLEPVSDKYPHFFISNNEEIRRVYSRSFGWTPIVYDDIVYDDSYNSSIQAKVPKALPHIFPELEEFDYLLYVDDKLKFNVDRIPDYISILKENNSPLAVREHNFLPQGDKANVLYEFAESMYQIRYRIDWEKTIQYITDEVNKGYTLSSDKSLLTGYIFRNMRHPDIVNINNMWYEHIQRGGICCQVSFHFIKQRFNNFSVLPYDIS